MTWSIKVSADYSTKRKREKVNYLRLSKLIQIIIEPSTDSNYGIHFKIDQGLYR